jgi:hypothetical protein
MNITTSVKPTEKKDHFQIHLNGLDLGVWERSQVRQFIQDLDNAI